MNNFQDDYKAVFALVKINRLGRRSLLTCSNAQRTPRGEVPDHFSLSSFWLQYLSKIQTPNEQTAQRVHGS